MSQVTIFVCTDKAEAQNAEARLLTLGYPSGGIKSEAIDKLSYDGRTFHGGVGGADIAIGGFIVVGRK